MFEVFPAGQWTGATKYLTLPKLAQADTAGGPSAARATKFSVSVVNCSNALKRGGRVTYLNSSQRLPSRASALDMQSIVDGFKSSPYRRRITGEVLGRPLKLVGYPMDSVHHTNFKFFKGQSGSEIFRYMFTSNQDPAAFDHVPLERGVSIVAYVFDPVQDEQEYIRPPSGDRTTPDGRSRACLTRV